MADLVGFVDPETDLGDWIDGPDDEKYRDRLLRVAHERVLRWAPDPLPAVIPDSYSLAQVLLVKHLWARKRAGDGEGFGADGYMLSTYPLVREAHDLMNPSPFRGLL